MYKNRSLPPNRSIQHRHGHSGSDPHVRRRVDLECATPGCGQPADGSCGFCAACYAWNRKGIHFSTQERNDYLWRRRRLVTRAEVLSTIHVRVTAKSTVSDVFSSGSMRTTSAARRSTRARRKARSR